VEVSRVSDGHVPPCSEPRRHANSSRSALTVFPGVGVRGAGRAGANVVDSSARRLLSCLYVCGDEERLRGRVGGRTGRQNDGVGRTVVRRIADCRASTAHDTTRQLLLLLLLVALMMMA